MFLERFKEVENFTITKLPLGGSNSISVLNFYIFNIIYTIIFIFVLLNISFNISSISNQLIFKISISFEIL